ncbi:MAG: hypothetical protein J3K34DRAFT_457600 [Monoraphidium minutum]|nr:MAG: hypothetical protein J3K34DRAFT_457600 [Monoraphidium minutum]
MAPSMLRSLKKTFSWRGSGGKAAFALDSSHRSTTSASSGGPLFALDDADAAAAAAAPPPLQPQPASPRGGAAAAPAPAPLDPASTAYQVCVLLSRSTFFEHKLQSDAARAAAALPLAPSPDGTGGGGRAGDVARVARALAGWGYPVIVRRVVHSKAYWTRAFDNAFIVALDAGGGAGAEYIVDPHFRELFRTAAMSGRYSALWESLPRVFVGMPCQLQPVVQLVCEEVEAAFHEEGRPCPPWRGWAATINRWMSDDFVDIRVPLPDAAQDEVDAFFARCAAPAPGAAAGAAAAGGGGAAVGIAGTSGGSACGGGGDMAARGSSGASGAGALPRSMRGRRPSDGAAGGVPSGAGSWSSAAAKRAVQQPLRAQVGFEPSPPVPASRQPFTQQQQQQPSPLLQQQPFEQQFLQQRVAAPVPLAWAPRRSSDGGGSGDGLSIVYASSSGGGGSPRDLEGFGGGAHGPPRSPARVSDASTQFNDDDCCDADDCGGARGGGGAAGLARP